MTAAALFSPGLNLTVLFLWPGKCNREVNVKKEIYKKNLLRSVWKRQIQSNVFEKQVTKSLELETVGCFPFACAIKRNLSLLK